MLSHLSHPSQPLLLLGPRGRLADNLGNGEGYGLWLPVCFCSAATLHFDSIVNIIIDPEVLHCSEDTHVSPRPPTVGSGVSPVSP